MHLKRRNISYQIVISDPGQAERYFQRMWNLSRHPSTPIGSEWRPQTDVYETQNSVVVQMEIGGMREEDISVTSYRDMLIIEGRREAGTPPVEISRYHEASIQYGQFRSEVFLPVQVDVDRASATYERGFLSVILPKVGVIEKEG